MKPAIPHDASRCTAICDRPLNTHVKPGERCIRRATHHYDGQRCCWVHYQAANNTERPYPIKWSRRENPQ